MAALAPYTEADRVALKRAIAQGAKTVQFADRIVTYRSIDDLLKALIVVEASLNNTTPIVARQTRMQTRKGYHA